MARLTSSSKKLLPIVPQSRANLKSRVHRRASLFKVKEGQREHLLTTDETAIAVTAIPAEVVEEEEELQQPQPVVTMYIMNNIISNKIKVVSKITTTTIAIVLRPVVNHERLAVDRIEEKRSSGQRDVESDDLVTIEEHRSFVFHFLCFFAMLSFTSLSMLACVCALVYLPSREEEVKWYMNCSPRHLRRESGEG
jgi:hypothetical protein